MTTFALIHGAYHGAWCWSDLADELTRRGHAAIAVDLPIEDPDAGTLEYAETMSRALGDREAVVAVGHSLGGLTVPVLATLRPVEHLVFIAGLVPRPGRPFSDEQASDADILLERGDDRVRNARGVYQPRTFTRACERYYNDLPLEAAYRAWQRLRPQSTRPKDEICPLDAWPDVPAASIVMRDDRAVSEAYSRAVAAELLHVTPVVLPGGHSPFLSRPAALADALIAAVGPA